MRSAREAQARTRVSIGTVWKGARHMRAGFRAHRPSCSRSFADQVRAQAVAKASKSLSELDWGMRGGETRARSWAPLCQMPSQPCPNACATCRARKEPQRRQLHGLDFSLAADGHQKIEAADIAKTSFEGSFSRRLTEARWAGWSVGRAGRRTPRDLQDAMLKSY